MQSPISVLSTLANATTSSVLSAATMIASRYEDCRAERDQGLRDLESRLGMQEAEAGGQTKRTRIGLEIRNAAPNQPGENRQQDRLADIARHPLHQNGARHLRRWKRRHARQSGAQRAFGRRPEGRQRMGIDIITPPLATSALRPRSRRSGVFGSDVAIPHFAVVADRLDRLVRIVVGDAELGAEVAGHAQQALHVRDSASCAPRRRWPG